jgi:hypothetical protein
VYGHKFYQASAENRVKFINNKLNDGRFDSIEEVAADMFINIVDMMQELLLAGYLFVHQINKFVRFELEL